MNVALRGSGGRGRVSATALAAVLVITAGYLAASAGAGHSAAPPPMLRRSSVAGGPVELVIDSVTPTEPAQLLFFAGRPAVPASGGLRVVVSESATLLASDERLELRPLGLVLRGRTALSVAPAPDGGWWVATQDGALIRTDAGGVGRSEWHAPFLYTALWSDPRGGGVYAARSPERFSFLPEPGPPSLAIRLDSAALPRARLGGGPIPAHQLLASLANAGSVVALGDTVFFAPISRPGVVALGSHGDTLWISSAHDAPPAAEPRFALTRGSVRIDYQPTNLALTLGPDGMLYLLRAADTTMTEAWLDVLDAGSGRVVRTAKLPSPRATLAASQSGHVYVLDDLRLLGAIPADSREELEPFDLPRLGGGRATLSEYGGKIALLNFWASWCPPCRREMPALDTLQRALAGDQFAFLALNDDAGEGSAADFAAEIGVRFPILLGRGGLERQYHYPGLPYTVLVDRRGRVIRRWIGELAPRDYSLIRTLVSLELARAARENPGNGGGPADHRHHPDH